jgi:hypothetical protein
MQQYHGEQCGELHGAVCMEQCAMERDVLNYHIEQCAWNE